MSSGTLTYIRTADNQFQCPHCDKKCEKQNTMYYHIKKIHLQDFKYVCSFCKEGDQMKFVQKCSYLQHLATCHPEHVEKTEEENPYVGVSRSCPACDHTTHTKANMLVHFARTHCKDWIAPYTKGVQCSGCQKDFASSTAYLYHAIGCLKPVPESYAKMIEQIK
jgi:hypothetical protein